VIGQLLSLIYQKFPLAKVLGAGTVLMLRQRIRIHGRLSIL
jgi:hypothetical protein